MFRDESVIGCFIWQSAFTAAKFFLLPSVAICEGNFLNSFQDGIEVVIVNIKLGVSGKRLNIVSLTTSGASYLQQYKKILG